MSRWRRKPGRSRPRRTRVSGVATAEQLDTAYAAVAPRFTPEMTAALHRYQEGGYRHMNAFRRPNAPRTGLGRLGPVLRHIQALDEAIDLLALPFPVRAYRGVHDVERVLQPRGNDLGALVGHRRIFYGFVSTSLSREKAVRFVPPYPPGRSRGLMVLEIPAGTAALWVPPFGVIDRRNEFELLLTHGTEVRINRVVPEVDTGIITVEVEVLR